jgi:hypothetical protein
MAARVVRIVKKVASMSTLVVVTLWAGAAARWLGMQPDGQAEQFWVGPGAVERFAEQAGQGRDQLTALSERDRSAFERSEQQFQSYQDWPGIKPQPVEPAKVLDAR